MLCKRGISPRKGYWNLPAGFLENGETVEEGAIRETYEETRAKVQIKRLHAVYSIPHVNQVNLHFEADMLDSHYETTFESTEIAFFPLDGIPWEEIAFSSHEFSIKAYLKNRGKQAKVVARGAYLKSSPKKANN
jgi:ADP-ribose pyrophosphatase YjhB (NUDIX family)